MQYIDHEILYVHSRIYPWGAEKYRCCLHLYYQPYVRTLAVDRFNKALLGYKKLAVGKSILEHEDVYNYISSPEKHLHVE